MRNKKLHGQYLQRLSLLLMCILLLAGCGVEEQPRLEQSDQETSEEQTTTSHDVNEAEIDNEQTQKNEPDLVDATVTRIIDGDTMEVNINGKQDSVRLLLVDTPETKHPNKAVQKFGPEASEFARETLAGKRVQLEFDGPERDKYDRLLVYLWVDGKMFNQMLLENGLARYAYVYDPPYTHSSAYTAAQTKAKENQLGIWSIEGYVTDEGFTDYEQTTNSQPENSEQQTNGGLPFDPSGPDRDCGDFTSQAEAQQFYEAAGGPDQDPHRLDGNDRDGIVCESL